MSESLTSKLKIIGFEDVIKTIVDNLPSPYQITISINDGEWDVDLINTEKGDYLCLPHLDDSVASKINSALCIANGWKD